jgi:phasin
MRMRLVPMCTPTRNSPNRSIERCGVTQLERTKALNTQNTQAKAKPTIANATEQVRDLSEKGAEKTRQSFETMRAAATDGADVMQNYYSTAFRAIQEYNSKVVEFAQANTKSYADFVQRLAGVKSPSEFFELSSNHARHQIQTIAEQATQLAELTQKTTLAAAEPLKAGFAKYAQAA